jgi:hypothetical protein
MRRTTLSKHHKHKWPLLLLSGIYAKRLEHCDPIHQSSAIRVQSIGEIGRKQLLWQLSVSRFCERPFWPRDGSQHAQPLARGTSQ